MSRIGHIVSQGVTAFNTWLGSTAGFIQSVILTLLWLPLVIFGYDPHGQLYLYMATALSLITQFSVAIYARQLERGQATFEEYVAQMLQNQSDLMKFMIGEVDNIDKDLDEIKDELGLEADD